MERLLPFQVLVLSLVLFGAVTSDKVPILSEPPPTGFGTNSSGPCAQALAHLSAFPGEQEYTAGAVVNNPAYSSLQPAFIAFPKSAEDIQTCLRCAYNHSVPFTVKSGGHSTAGYSTIDGSNNGAFLIHLGEMNEVVVDEDSHTVWVQAGARWSDVYGKVDDSKYLVVGGACSMVGVSGYTLGGGYSLLSRYLGLATDSVLSFTMVTANGSSVVVANDTNNSDLYWALRGGGGGNFGVVLDFTIRLHPIKELRTSDAPMKYVYGTMMFNASVSESVLKTVFESDPIFHRLYLNVVVLPSKELKVDPFFIDNGDKDVDLDSLLKPLIAEAYNVSLRNYTSFFEIAKLVEKENGYVAVSPHPERVRACVIGGESYSDAASIFFKYGIPETCVIAFMHIGGVSGYVPPTETAYYHRNGAFDYYAPCLYSNSEEKSTVDEFENNLYNDLHSSGHCVGSYVNDIDRELRNWQREYYGGNYQRLVEIKEQWNPLNQGTFHFLQEIGSEYNP